MSWKDYGHDYRAGEYQLIYCSTKILTTGLVRIKQCHGRKD